MKFFKEQFRGAKNFLANNNLKMELYGEDYCLIADYTYERNICIFSTRRETLKNEIMEYLIQEGYNVVEG